MKPISLFLAGSLFVNLALIAVLALGPAEPAASSTGTAAVNPAAPSPSGGSNVSVMTAGKPTPSARPAWNQLRTEDPAALVPKLREAGFPPEVIRRVIVALVAERFDARRLALEKELLDAPFWQNAASSYNDPKLGPEMIKLQREQIETTKKILGGSLNDVFAGTEEDKAMLKLQIGDISPERLDQLYAAAMDYSTRRQKINAERGNSGPMLPADYEKITAVDKAYREELGKILPANEATEFILRQSDAASRLRNMIAPARPTEAEYRAVFPIYQEYLDRFPGYSNVGESPELAAARRTAEAQMLAQIQGVVGNERAADFQQAGNPQQQQLNRLVARLDLPISAATQVTAVQSEMQQRVTALREDTTLNGPARVAQLVSLQQEATRRVSTVLGGERGLEAYKQYGGQWLTNMAPRPPQPPKN
jgi:hypothetical protein